MANPISDGMRRAVLAQASDEIAICLATLTSAELHEGVQRCGSRVLDHEMLSRSGSREAAGERPAPRRGRHPCRHPDPAGTLRPVEVLHHLGQNTTGPGTDCRGELLTPGRRLPQVDHLRGAARDDDTGQRRRDPRARVEPDRDVDPRVAGKGVEQREANACVSRARERGEEPRVRRRGQTRVAGCTVVGHQLMIHGENRAG